MRAGAAIQRLLLRLAAGALGVGAHVLVEFVFLRGRRPPIDTPRGIASLETRRLGGVEQSILIRGHDRSRPVLLCLHGGPGMPAMYLAHSLPAGAGARLRRRAPGPARRGPQTVSEFWRTVDPEGA